MQLYPLAILFLGGLILTIGDVVMKGWVESQRLLFYLIGLLIYLIGLVFLVESYKYENIAIASIIFVVFNVVTLALVSWVVYHENLNIWQVSGILLGLIAVTILTVRG